MRNCTRRILFRGLAFFLPSFAKALTSSVALSFVSGSVARTL